MELTELEKIQNEAASRLFLPTQDRSRAALDAYLSQAFDAGVRACQELALEGLIDVGDSLS